MGLRSFLEKQFVDVIQWTEPDSGVLAYRYPMTDLEIQNGAQLTVRCRCSQCSLSWMPWVSTGRHASVHTEGV